MITRRVLLGNLVATIVILFFAATAKAGTFTPGLGTTISESTLTVAWNSTDPQQWVRVFDPSGAKIFDSGRLSAASGEVRIDIPEELESVRVIFYEKVAGVWTPQERTYPVDLGAGSGGGGGPVIVSNRISCFDDTIAPEFLTILETGIVFEELAFIEVLDCELVCPTGEYLISTNCNAELRLGSEPDIIPVPLITTMEHSDASNSASCAMFGQFNNFLDLGEDNIERPLVSSISSMRLTASGACMSVP